MIDQIEGEVSYAELGDRVRRMAAALKSMGVRPGDRILSCCDKSLNALIAQLAVMRIGAIHNPVNPAIASGELAHVIADAAPSLAVTGRANLDVSVATIELSRLVELADTETPSSEKPEHGDGTAVILYTSGTTGRPKGAVITHRMWLTLLEELAVAWQITPADRLLHVLPIFHGHGLALAALLPLLCGATIDFRLRFDMKDFVDRIRDATVVMAVPTIYSRLVEAKALTPESCQRMRLFVSGSAALPGHVHAAFRTMTGQVILERYGTTETGIICSNPVDGERKPGKVGRPLSCVEMRIVDADRRAVPVGEVGEIQVRGPTVFDHYWNKPREAKDFSEDGYFIPGDLGRCDHDGYVEIVGRSKEMIVSGGFNIYPAEVENALREDPAVLDVAVFGVPHPDFGEAAIAAIILGGGAERSEEAMSAFLRGYLTPYKIPKRFIFVSDLPRNAMGKVQRNILGGQHRSLFDRPSDHAVSSDIDGGRQ
ncbi:MAG: AMP-binding protein [Mesorhizobium sp.]|nr:AMP-binding protein [Mesorhizobium sp.]